MGFAVDIALDAGATVGEGPVWDEERQELVWVDIPKGLVHRWSSIGGAATPQPIGQPVGAVALRRSGGLVVAMRDGFGTTEGSAPDVELRREVERADRTTRMNDGKCDAAGRFWAGTMELDMAPGRGSLYRLDPDYGVTSVLDGLGVPNGLAWTSDGRTMYFIDSLAGGIDAYDFDPDEGRIGTRRRLVDVPPDAGLPDGMTIDADGHLWVAFWGSGTVRRFAPDGRLGIIVNVPASQVTSCTFGGRELDELYVTSAADDIAPEQRRDEPHAGAVFCVRPGVTGLPADRFAG
ncbi:N/A [soil metagenome]